MIALDASHIPAIEALLAPHRADAMFILSNLRAQGFGGTHPHGMRVWADALVPTTLLGLTNGGVALPYLPDSDQVDDAAQVLRGRSLVGIIGPAPMARPLLAHLGLADAPTGLNADEPQFLLDLADLAVPEGPGTLVPLDQHRQTALAWRLASNRETGAGAQTPEGVADEVDRWIRADRGRLLVDGDTPLAMTGLNAVMPNIVQIGGVFTPPALRGRRHAGRAVALHMEELRAARVAQATLFAASQAAVRSYLRLGFRHIGTFALVLFDGKVTP